MRIGITFDLAPTGPDAPDAPGPDDQFEEFDKPETVEAIASVLRGRGHEVVLLGDGPDFLRRALDDPPDLVWNIAEGQGVGRCREARVPAVLEMLGIPYTGSDPLTLAATLDKGMTRRLLAHELRIAQPSWLAFEPGADEAEFSATVGHLLSLPGAERLLLKPSFEGSSKGIRSRCLVASVADAWTTFNDLARDYRQTILVEEFIGGDEVTVGLVGDGVVLGAMRVVPKEPSPEFVYSLEVKRDWRRRVDYEAPAHLAANVRAHLEDTARDACRILGCRDVARIDYRIRDGIPYFIEANPLPGLAPETSDLVILAKGHGIDYDDLIGRILDAALARLGLGESSHGTGRR